MTRRQIDQILELPAPERVAIVQEIWESVAEESAELPLTATQRAELERRWLDFQRDPDEGESWDDVKKTFGQPL